MCRKNSIKKLTALFNEDDKLFDAALTLSRNVNTNASESLQKFFNHYKCLANKIK